MGYGFPAAIGASVAFPNKTVFCIDGDGSFQMNVQEIATAVMYRLPIKVAILNNGFLGMVRQWQDLFYDKRYSFTCMNASPDFVKLAEAYGARALRATEKEQVEKVLEEGMSVTDGPIFMEFRVAREENVFPMVPSGAAVHEMIEGNGDG